MAPEIQSEVEEALKIARQVRDSILSGKGTLETQLLGFETVAQVLGRTNDLVWVEREFNGYGKDDLVPNYRQNIRGQVYADSINEWRSFQLSRVDRSVPRLLAITEDEKTTTMEGRFEQALITDALKSGIRVAMTDKFVIHRNDILGLLSLIKRELLKRLNVMITEITYGNIPEGIFKGFQSKVNERLTQSNPDAVSELNIAYESLGRSEDPERTAHVAFATRRLIKAVADKLYPSKNGEKVKLNDGRELEIGDERFLNRLEAYVDSKDSPNSKHLIKEISLLRDLLSNVPESLNKGVHSDISNTEARRLVLYSYMILGDVLLFT